MLNARPDGKEGDVVKSIMRNWLSQTGLEDTASWVARCNGVLTKLTVKEDATKTAPAATAKTTGPTDLQDEEVAGFAAASGRDDAAGRGYRGEESV